MVDAQNYSAICILRDGRRVEIRSQRPDDLTNLIAAVERTSAQSLFRRFFAVKRYFSDREIAFFSNVDFINQVALVVVADEAGRPAVVAGGRYVLVKPGRAEVAFTVIDQYQGLGIGSELIRHLVAIARKAGLKELIAEVLPDNTAMLRVFEKSSYPIHISRGSDVVSITLDLQSDS